MAGIGFELRRLLRKQTYLGQLQAYGYASAISSGPWLLSILIILAIGVLGRSAHHPGVELVQFQVVVTYLIGASLLLTGALQLTLSRFIADRLFEKKDRVVAPNLLGAMLVVTVSAGLLGLLLTFLMFPGPLALRLLLTASFTVLSDIWLVVVVLSSLKAYRAILYSFCAGYGLTLCMALVLRPLGLCGLLAGFLTGQALLFFLLLGLVLRAYPGQGLVALDFLRRGQFYPKLALTGLLYNLAIWADKIVFWFNPKTSEAVLGPCRASGIYDIPIFLAYLSIIPGMGVFLVRIETDFAEQYDAFYTAVREGETLANIERIKDRMVEAVRQGIYEIFKVQGLTVIVLLLIGERLLSALGISTLHARLFYVDVAAAGVQVLLLSIINVFFYLDQQRIAVLLSVLFLVANAGLTALTQALGPSFYGYGFAAAVLIAGTTGLGLLTRKLDRLEYETFMLQQFS